MPPGNSVTKGRTRTRAARFAGVTLCIGAHFASPVSAQRSVPTDGERLPRYSATLPSGGPQATPPETADRPVTQLAEALALAYEGNPTLLAQRARLRSTDHRYPAARAAYGPSLDLQASATYQRDDVETAAGPFIAQSGWSTTAAAIVSQPLFTFGRNRASENIALGEVAFARDTLRLTEAQVMVNVVNAYIGLSRDEEILRLSESNLALLTRQYSENQARFQAREITATDLQQVETRVQLGEADYVRARGDVGSSRAFFLQTIGAFAGTLSPAPALVIPVATLDDAYAVAERGSPVLRAAQSREKISRASVEAAKAEFRPRVDAQASAGYLPVSPYSDSLRATQVQAGAQLRWPLIDSGVRLSRLREAREANDGDWRLIDQALRETRQAVAASWDRYRAADASLSHYQKAVNAAQAAYDGAVAQQKYGAISTFEVLNLARELLNVQTNFAVARANSYLSRASLLAAMGLLEAPIIDERIKAYDETANFRRYGQQSDLPLVTDTLSAIDSLTVGSTAADRPVRDPAGPLRSPSAMDAPAATAPPRP